MPLDGCGHRRRRVIVITALEQCRGQDATLTLSGFQFGSQETLRDLVSPDGDHRSIVVTTRK